MDNIFSSLSPSSSIKEKIEEENNSVLISLIHSKKSGAFGLSFLDSYKTVSLSDAACIIRILRDIDPNKTLDIVVNTTGGDLTHTEVICNALINHKGLVRVYIPLYAYSAGTLIALCGDEIHIEKNGVLGQVDPQLGWLSANTILEFSDSESIQNFLILNQSWIGDAVKLLRTQAQKAFTNVERLLTKICIAKGYEEDKIKKLIVELASGKYNHDKPFFYKDVKDFIPNISEGISDNILEFFDSKVT